MLKRFIVAVAVATGLTLAAPVALLPAAQADTPTCVSKKEFRKVKKGFSMARVHNIFDVNGRQTWSGFGMQGRQYRACTSRWGFVDVTYERRNGKWRLDSKFAYWG